MRRARQKIRLKKGDVVQVLWGEEKGKKGKILSVNREKGVVVVEGVNLAVRHTRPRGRMRQAGKVDVPQPIPVSRVMRVCPHCGKPTRLRRVMRSEGWFWSCLHCEEVFR
ncbi:MAG: 50S ribosomal protein L24 [bacterium]